MAKLIRFRTEHEHLEVLVKPGGTVDIRRCETGRLRVNQSSHDPNSFEVLAPLRTLSQLQAQLRVLKDDEVTIIDCGSTNGTLGQLWASRPYVLSAFASFRLGPELVVEVDSARWQLPDRSELAVKPEELPALVLFRLRDFLDAVFIEETARVIEWDAEHAAFPLLPGTQRLVVRFRARTINEEAHRYLRSLVSLYNTERAAIASQPGWQFVTASAGRAQVLELARRVAPSHLALLIRGPSGVGKGVLAQDIHSHSPRRDEPFVTVNCAAIPEQLLESELFGVQQGAFTGATHSRRGAMQRADKGTIFLDEIGELPLQLQPKLLRVLESGRVQALGSEVEKRVDVRVMAATLRNLEEMVEKGQFREDLYHRLCGVQIAIPPLATADVAMMARMLLGEAEELTGIRLGDHERETVLSWASAATWRGAGRELQFALSRYLLLRGSERSPADTWKRACETGSMLQRPAKRAQVAGRLTKQLLTESRDVAQTLDSILFLGSVRETLIEQKGAGISEIAEVVQMTYGGVKAKLKRLGIEFSQDRAAEDVEKQLAQQLEELAPFVPSLKELLGWDRV